MRLKERLKTLTFITLGVGLLSLAPAVWQGAVSKDVKLNTKIGNVTAKEVKTEKAELTKYSYSINDVNKGVQITATLYKVKTKDGKELYFISAFHLENGTLVPVKNYEVKNIPVDVSYLQNLEKKFKALGIDNHIGKEGRPKLYVIFDAFCPFCIQSFKTHCSKLAQKYDIYLIPFAVHGAESVNALTCMMKEAQKKNIHEVLGKYFGKFDGDWNKYRKLFPDCSGNTKIQELIEVATQTLLKHGVDATPTFIYQKGGKFYVSVGQIPNL